ncbi:MAG: hypothetical protein RL026_302 [Pseudomonadota bacterium]
MPRRLIRKFTPKPETLRQQWYFRMFGSRVTDSRLWSPNRRSVTAAFGAGLAICFVPLPIHFLLAIGAALLWRLNLPVVFASTYVMNPLTVLPMYYGAYRVGALLVGAPPGEFAFELSWEWLQVGLGPVWKPFLVGCLVCGAGLGLAGYAGLEVLWRWVTLRRLGRRRRRVSR